MQHMRSLSLPDSMDSSLSNNPNQQQNSTMIKPFDPSDIDSPGFDPETYVTKLLRESRLTALIDKEQLLTKQIKIYDNEMQTLVYENYNKFISATDTIRQMKKDFKKMEDEMSNLITNMNSINTFNHKIHLTLDVRRQEIRKLTSIHLLLQKIQYLFQLPTKLKEYANLGQYDQAVHTYTKALKALKKYEQIPSFNHIQTTCTDTMNVIREQLKQEFDQQQQASIEVIELLLELGESPDYLSEQFLMQNQQRLQQPLDLMKQQLIVAENQFTTKQQQSSGQVPMDILDFVDSSYNNYLKNVYLFVESYENLFIRNNEISDDEFKERCKYNIETFILNLYDNYLKFIYDLYKSKYYGCDDDTQLYVRSIDRFIRRSTIDINKYMITQRSLEKIKLYLDEFLLYAIECRLKYYHNIIEKHYHEQIIDLRKSLTMLNNNSESNSLSPTIKTVSSSSSPNLMDYVDKMLKQITNDIKQTFQNLSLFLSNDIQFSKKNSTFLRQFSSHYVWDNLFLNLLNKLCSHFEQEYTTNLTVSSVIKSSSSSLYEQSSPPILLLMLSKFVLNFDSSSIPYLCTIFEEKFNIVLESTSQRKIWRRKNRIYNETLENRTCTV
ncbi:unnamed protein product [Didymodactylos carnosus]|uniref:Vacuolar protein sorting-associated protein 51 homolog n=1 Tax=Didymodactylos carnosus TaxID=1234261 RepID=A0A8S2E876_9BILA|nr:unnamed protein product [Didymodactylos carnosus]CAF3856419.1 unnamed protein product [Didymodactylos carnosus]